MGYQGVNASTGGTFGGTETVVTRNSNGISSFTNMLPGFTSTAGGGTITLTVNSNRNQIITGSGTTNIILPNATTLSNGWIYNIYNSSSGQIAVKLNNGSTLLSDINSKLSFQVFLTNNGTSNGTWDYQWRLPKTETNGQIIIGSSTTHWTLNDLITTGGVVITEGAGSLTVTNNGSMPYSNRSSNFSASVGNAYFITASCIATMPTGVADGDRISFIIENAGVVLTIQAAGGYSVQIGNAISAANGTASASTTGASISLYAFTATTRWTSLESPQGIWTVT